MKGLHASLLVVCFAGGLPGEETYLSETASQFRQQLRSDVMPYWYEQAQDRQHGGYLLEEGSKHLVGQTRMIWGFSHAHLFGLSSSDRDYLAAARQGYEFLIKHFLDTQHGGYFWLTDEKGDVRNPNKMLYGQAFVIYGLVEYYRASGDKGALRQAQDQFRVIQRKAYDSRHGGWFEHFLADWTPVMEWRDDVSVEVPGYKSANAHLHLMEALTELYLEWPDARLREALVESLKINRERFYPADPSRSVFHCKPDWGRVLDEDSQGLSYGHNVEFAWLMLRAEKTLEQPLSWPHFYAHIDHALEFGFDHERGGLYNKGLASDPAFDRVKVWWAQAELIAALTVSLARQERKSDLEAMRKTVTYLQSTMIDASDGIWIASFEADGKPKWNSKKNHWKANYHDVRALVMMSRAFAK
jgi:mannose/cellobiose epimerase-like protein (N-acyl-D-glucosamine 2-epimerase family)